MNSRLQLKKYAMFLVVVLLVMFFSITSEAFLCSENLLNIARQVSMLGIASVGMTFALLLGGIDLSIGSMITLVNIVTAYLMVIKGIHPILAIVLALTMSLIIGLLNGFIISKIRIAPLIVTLSSMTILEGISYMICGGVPIFGFPKGFSVIGQGYIGIIPIPVLIMIGILLLGSFILNKTYFGRYFYAVGDNPEAAKLSGINVDGIICLVYALSGLFAGIAGIVMLSRTNSGQALAGKGFEFDCLTAVVLGGVSVNGGAGKIANVVAGVAIIGILSNGMVLLNVSQYVQMVAKGALILLAVGFDCIQRYRRLEK